MEKTASAVLKTTRCPVCHNTIQVPATARLADVPRCPYCKKYLEVVSQTPLILGNLK